MLPKIREASEFILSRISSPPRVGLITGTGLGGLTSAMAADLRIPYEEIPHFPRSTTAGHQGTLAFGRVGGANVLAMEGRFHLYEGYSSEEVTFPVRVMSHLGADVLMISSAAGGLNPLFQPADLMVVTDHINLTGRNPLVGPNLDAFGPRFPDMSRVYDRHLLALARELSLAALVEVHTEAELERALDSGARAVGINNRNLETFEVSLQTTFDLVAGIPNCVVKVSESGIESPLDVGLLRDAGVDAILVGEHLMRQDNVRSAARSLMSG